MLQKSLVFQNRFLPTNNRVVGAGFRYPGAKKNIINEITQSMGGMLISDRNVIKGKGIVKGPERKRPIRFIV
jgi:hypothetical protein